MHKSERPSCHSRPQSHSAKKRRALGTRMPSYWVLPQIDKADWWSYFCYIAYLQVIKAFFPWSFYKYIFIFSFPHNVRPNDKFFSLTKKFKLGCLFLNSGGITSEKPAWCFKFLERWNLPHDLMFIPGMLPLELYFQSACFLLAPLENISQPSSHLCPLNWCVFSTKCMSQVYYRGGKVRRKVGAQRAHQTRGITQISYPAFFAGHFQ